MLLKGVAKKASKKLTTQHIDYLGSQQVLAEWRPYALTARCAKFEQKFPGKNISRWKMRKVYKHLGVTKRKLKDDIYLSKKQLETQQKGRLYAFPHIIGELNAQRRVYYCDESVFSSTQS